MAKLIFLQAVFLFAISRFAFAQDPHFSQYFASPLSVNPANTGFFDGTYRVAINERKQWWNVGNSYQTTSVNADIKLSDVNRTNYNLFAVGVSGIFESSLNGSLQSNFVSATGAYHMSLDYNGKQSLGIGLSLNYSSKFIDITKLTFASQFNGSGFDASIPVNYNGNNFKTSYFDINAGLLYVNHLNKANFYTGGSVYHINQPQEHVFSPQGIVPYRLTLHGGGDLTISPVSVIVFSGYFMQQGGATDGTLGGAWGIKLNSNEEQLFKMYFGVWYKVSDAYIPYLGFDYLDYSIGINYSTPTSKQLYFSPQSFEVSFIYRHKAHKLPFSLNSYF